MARPQDSRLSDSDTPGTSTSSESQGTLSKSSPTADDLSYARSPALRRQAKSEATNLWTTHAQAPGPNSLEDKSRSHQSRSDKRHLHPLTRQAKARLASQKVPPQSTSPSWSRVSGTCLATPLNLLLGTRSRPPPFPLLLLPPVRHQTAVRTGAKATAASPSRRR